MRIFVVTAGFYPDNYHINQMVQDISARGHQVTVLTGLPDYATGTVPAEYRGFKKSHECMGPVEVWRVPTVARRKGAVMRFFSYLSFMITGGMFALFKKLPPMDVIYVWGISPITAAVPAIMLKKRYKKPLFFYCLDLWPESMKAFKVGEKSPIFKAVYYLTRWIYRQFDRVAVTSKPFIDYIHTINKYPLEKITYLPQYGAEQYLTQDFTSLDNGIVDLLFAGNIGFVQDIDKIIEAAFLIRDLPGFHVHIVGDGSAKYQFEKLAKDKNLMDKITFHGRVPAGKMTEFYKLADACLLTLDGSSKIGDTLPVKMQGYMAAGKPILAAINGAGREVVEESGCGLVVGAGDVPGLARIMKEFVQHPQQYTACGPKGREYFKIHFTKREHLARLEHLLGEMADKPRSSANLRKELSL